MANMKCALPNNLVGSILSFTVHGKDISELNRMREISPMVRKAIDCNEVLFNKEEPLLEIRGHKDDSLNGVWYLKSIKTRQTGPNMNGAPGGFYPPNPVRNIQQSEIHSKGYYFERESPSGEMQEILVLSRCIVPRDEWNLPPPDQDDPMWKAYRMDGAKQNCYDIRVLPAGGMPLYHELVNGVGKPAIGQDTWSEKYERLTRFTIGQIPVRDQDRSSSRNPANYAPFEPGNWFQLTTALMPVYPTEQKEAHDRAKVAQQEALVACVEQLQGEMTALMEGRTPDEIPEIQASPEFMELLQRLTADQQAAREAHPVPPLEFGDEAWELGENNMEYFRARIFDSSGSLSPC